MKKTFTFLTIIVLSAFAFRVNAQSGFSDLIKSSPADATKLINAYGEPLFKGFGVGMNSGWNSTAKAKKKLKFELRISASGAFVPASSKSFDVTQLGLSDHVGVQPGSPNNTATFGGKDEAVTTLNTYNDSHQKVGEFKMPKGVTPIIPAPQIQLTVGVIKNTDLTLRVIPKVKLGDDIGSVSQFGFGVKHNIMPDILGKKAKVVPFDLALAFGYSRLNLDIPLDVKPEGNAQPESSSTKTDFSNQRIDGHFNNFQLQAIISKKLTVFTPFLAVGYNTSKTNVAALGNYPVTTDAILGQKYYTTYTDPVSIKKTSINGLRADLGFQLELGFFRIYAAAAVAEYTSVNAGIGFGF
ncbi:hypothetical protein FFF34_009040 [Inquilinus sp. KBS0705]|nr:hypothetical protein FFF34_009040 [Inquilinus sp. KBS0705]